MTAPIPYAPPKYWDDAFNCPFCHAYSNQKWGGTYFNRNGLSLVPDYSMCQCTHCGRFSVWVNEKMIFPLAVVASPPNPDIPDDIKQDYEEARAISSQSPRGAAALLRLCIQKLCKHLGESGENINSDIATLVKKGLPLKIQQSLDLIRVVGNNAVHPGQIDLNDNQEITQKLFGIVNIIADVMISQPKHIDELYGTVVPDSQKKAINKRDGK
ncbi:MAG: DUF4145 domain-containing protein [Sedimentisphaerales bacterium]|jgi:hypothetical protein